MKLQHTQCSQKKRALQLIKAIEKEKKKLLTKILLMVGQIERDEKRGEKRETPPA